MNADIIRNKIYQGFNNSDFPAPFDFSEICTALSLGFTMLMLIVCKEIDKSSHLKLRCFSLEASG